MTEKIEGKKIKGLIILVIAALVLLLVPLRGALFPILTKPSLSIAGVSSTPGNIMLIISWFFAALSLIAVLVWDLKDYGKVSKFIPWALRVVGGLLTISVLLLTYYFVKSNFTILYVWQFSDKALPMVYKISAVWAGQEGTFLLWAWVVFVSAWWISERRGWNDMLVRKVQVITLLVGLFFLTLTLMVSPFRTIYDIYPDLPPNFVPPDGSGLNPLLVDPWMAVHPPIIFIAYGVITIPFAAALVFLLRRDEGWEEFARPWNRFSWLFLTLGIWLGGFWSYKVLGWGGFWAWDPVETSSFIPWLTLTGLMHASVQYRRNRKFSLFAPFLAISTFLLVVYATFITRSGLWESVHAFAETTTGPWLATAIANIIVVSAILCIDFAMRGERIKLASESAKDLIYSFFAAELLFIGYKHFIAKGKILPSSSELIMILILVAVIFLMIKTYRQRAVSKEEHSDENEKIREAELEKPEKQVSLITFSNLFYIAVILFTILAFVSFWGVTYPMLLQAKTGTKVSVGIEFFNKWSYPFTAFLIMLLGSCALLGRVRKDVLLKITSIAIVASVLSLIIKPFDNPYIDFSLPLFLFATGSVAYKIVGNIRSVKGTRRIIHASSAYVIHLGVAFVLVGAMVSTLFDVESSPVYSNFKLAAPEEETGSIKIGDIAANPSEFEGKIVQVTGTVISEPMIITDPTTQETYTYLTLDDGTGEIRVEYIGTGLFEQGSVVTVSGVLLVNVEIMEGYVRPIMIRYAKAPEYYLIEETHEVGRGYSVEFYSLKNYVNYEGYQVQDAFIKVYKGEKLVGEGHAKWIDNKEFGAVTRVYIMRGLLADVYVIFQGTGGYVIQPTIKVIPGISLLWFGLILFSVGILPLLFSGIALRKKPSVTKEVKDVEAKMLGLKGLSIGELKKKLPEIEDIALLELLLQHETRKTAKTLIKRRIKKKKVGVEVEREWLQNALKDVENSFKAGKISREMYKKLKKEYEANLKNLKPEKE